MDPALVFSYFGVYVSVANLIIKMIKSMIVQEIAMVKISFNALFLRTDRFGSIISVVFMIANKWISFAVKLKCKTNFST